MRIGFDSVYRFIGRVCNWVRPYPISMNLECFRFGSWGVEGVRDGSVYGVVAWMSRMGIVGYPGIRYL